MTTDFASGRAYVACPACDIEVSVSPHGFTKNSIRCNYDSIIDLTTNQPKEFNEARRRDRNMRNARVMPVTNVLWTDVITRIAINIETTKYSIKDIVNDFSLLLEGIEDYKSIMLPIDIKDSLKCYVDIITMFLLTQPLPRGSFEEKQAFGDAFKSLIKGTNTLISDHNTNSIMVSQCKLYSCRKIVDGRADSREIVAMRMPSKPDIVYVLNSEIPNRTVEGLVKDEFGDGFFTCVYLKYGKALKFMPSRNSIREDDDDPDRKVEINVNGKRESIFSRPLVKRVKFMNNTLNISESDYNNFEINKEIYIQASTKLYGSLENGKTDIGELFKQLSTQQRNNVIFVDAPSKRGFLLPMGKTPMLPMGLRHVFDNFQSRSVPFTDNEGVKRGERLRLYKCVLDKVYSCGSSLDTMTFALILARAIYAHYKGKCYDYDTGLLIDQDVKIEPMVDTEMDAVLAQLCKWKDHNDLHGPTSRTANLGMRMSGNPRSLCDLSNPEALNSIIDYKADLLRTAKAVSKPGTSSIIKPMQLDIKQDSSKPQQDENGMEVDKDELEDEDDKQE